MKKKFILLLLVSVVLGAFLAHKKNQDRSNSLTLRSVRTPADASVLPLNKAPTDSSPRLWYALETRNYPQLIEMLRASGCPEATIRDLILTRVSRDFHAQAVAIEEQRMLSLEWWRCGSDKQERVEESKAMRGLRGAMDARLYELLGVDSKDLLSGYLAWSDGSEQTWLSSDKRRAYRAMLDRFEDESEDISYGTPESNEQKAQLAELKKRQHDEMASFLSPSELEDYDLRKSDAARYVLNNLPPALSESEFRTMVKVVQQRSDDILTATSSQWDVDRVAADRTRVEAQKQEVLEEVKVALGQETVAAQEKFQEEQAAQIKKEDDARNDREFAGKLADIAESAGIDRAMGQKMLERIKQFPLSLPPSLVKADEATKMAYIEGELEKAAVEVMGDQGHAFAKKLNEKMPF